MTSDERRFALVLAGGRGRRMGAGPPKPFVELEGRPLAAHVIERLRPSVDRVLVSASPGPEWDWSGCEVVPDEGDRFGGPAVGIRSALDHLRRQLGGEPFRLVTAPTDAPFLPRDLVARLIATGRQTSVAVFRDAWVPTCAAWGPDDGPDWGDVAGRSIRSLLERRGAVAVPFAPDIEAPDANPFFNVNTRDDLAQAEEHARTRRFPGVRPVPPLR